MTTNSSSVYRPENLVSLTEHESKLANYLADKEKAYWEELAQFSKSPTTVKLKTIQKSISDLRRKFTLANVPVPFNCQLSSMLVKERAAKQTPEAHPQMERLVFNGQTLVKIKSNKPSVFSQECITPIKPAAILDRDLFRINHERREILTVSGKYYLTIEGFEILEYLMRQNRFVSLEELRDRVVFPNFGSKMPARWFNLIQSRVNNIRRQIPEAKNRILTVRRDGMGGYYFQ